MLRTISRMMSRAVAGLAAAGRSIEEPTSILTVCVPLHRKDKRSAEPNASDEPEWRGGRMPPGMGSWQPERLRYGASFTQRNPILFAHPRSGTGEVSQRPFGPSVSSAPKDWARTLYHGSSRLGGASSSTLNILVNSAKAPLPGGLT